MLNSINISTCDEKFPTYITTTTAKLQIFSDKNNEKNCKNLKQIYIECIKDHNNLIDLQCNKLIKLLKGFNCERPEKII